MRSSLKAVIVLDGHASVIVGCRDAAPYGGKKVGLEVLVDASIRMSAPNVINIKSG